jgi:TPR repeat protein
MLSNFVGLMYEIGNGLQKDLVEAERYHHIVYLPFLIVRYYKLAADQGHADGQYCLGILNESKEGVHGVLDDVLFLSYF